MPCRGPREVTVKQSAGKPVGAGQTHGGGGAPGRENSKYRGLKAGEGCASNISIACCSQNCAGAESVGPPLHQHVPHPKSTLS